MRLRQLLQRRLLLRPRDPITGVSQVLEAGPGGQVPPPAAGIHVALARRTPAKLHNTERRRDAHGLLGNAAPQLLPDLGPSAL